VQKIIYLSYSSFLDIWENVEWPRFFLDHPVYTTNADLAAYRNAFFHATPCPAVVLTDNYSDEHEQLLRPSGLQGLIKERWCQANNSVLSSLLVYCFAALVVSRTHR